METNGKKPNLFDKNELHYTPFYCEENVWKMCERIQQTQPEHLKNSFAVFVSNESKLTPIWCQARGDQDESGFVLWDYHVFLVIKQASSVFVYDFDTTLNFPAYFEEYCSKAIQTEENLNDKYKRKFRIVPAEVYLRAFASDRSHMRAPEGTYIYDPPPYPPIKTSETSNNIQDFISMAPDTGHGIVVDLSSFFRYFDVY